MNLLILKFQRYDERNIIKSKTKFSYSEDESRK